MSKRLLGPITTLFPMPTLLLVVKTGEETANVMTVAWAGIIGSGPVMMAVRIGGFHYSAPFIDREMNFTMNVPSSRLVAAVDYCGTASGHDDPNKIGTCGWTLLPSRHVSSPIIAECPLNFECRVVHRQPMGKGAIYLAEVLETHVDEEILTGTKEINAVTLDPVIYAPDRNYYRLGERIGREHQVGRALLERLPVHTGGC